MRTSAVLSLLWLAVFASAASAVGWGLKTGSPDSLVRAALTALFAFAMSTSLFAAEPAADGAQGITGKVIKLSGNFQPRVLLPGGAPPDDSGKRKVLAAPVHVFQGKVEPFEKPNPKHPQLVTIATPDKTGTFRVALAPGEYTVVAEIDGKLYFNLYTFDAATNTAAWGTVEVKPQEWAEWIIEETSEAAF